jgi:hypothetical protein
MGVFRFRALLSGVLALTASACTSVPLGSIPKLMSLQDGNFRASEVEVAVRFEDAFRTPADTAKLTFALVNEGAGVNLNEVFVLEPVTATPTPALRQAAKKGFLVQRFRIAIADRARLESVIARAKGLKAAKAGKSTLSASAGTGLCRPSGAPARSSVRMTVLLKVDPREDFFVLLKETRIQMKGAGVEKVKPCEG